MRERDRLEPGEGPETVIGSIPLARKSQVLSEISLFAGLSEKEVQALSQRAVEKRFDSGEMLFW